MKLTDMYKFQEQINLLKQGKMTSPLPNSGVGFPGERIYGADNMEAIQAFIRLQKKIRGYTFTFAAGSPASNQFKVAISGQANFLLGLSCISIVGPNDPANYPFEMNLKINNELVLETVHGASLSPFFMDNEYFSIPRPLSGQDSIIVSGDIQVSRDIAFAFYWV